MFYDLPMRQPMSTLIDSAFPGALAHFSAQPAFPQPAGAKKAEYAEYLRVNVSTNCDEQ